MKNQKRQKARQYGKRKQEQGLQFRIINYTVAFLAVVVFVVFIETFRLARAELYAQADQMPLGLYEELMEIMFRQHILVGCLLGLLILTVLLVMVLILMPLEKYIEELQSYQKLTLRGAYELRYLAQAYNSVDAENRRNRDHLLYQTEHDSLTGLFNRRAFNRLRSAREEEGNGGLVLIDVDRFKEVNDTCGHETGDRVLKKVADLLTRSFRPTDYPCRIGGDEFSVIITDISPSVKEVIREKMRGITQELERAEDGLPPVTLSVGTAFQSECPTGYDLYNLADRALYYVKEHGRNGCAFYGDVEAIAVPTPHPAALPMEVRKNRARQQA